MWNDSSTAVVRIYHSAEDSDNWVDRCVNMASSKENSSVFLGGVVIKVDPEIVLVVDVAVGSLLVDVIKDGAVPQGLLDDLLTFSSDWILPCVEPGIATVFFGGDEVNALAKITGFLVWVIMRGNKMF